MVSPAFEYLSQTEHVNSRFCLTTESNLHAVKIIVYGPLCFIRKLPLYAADTGHGNNRIPSAARDTSHM